ncbi:AAA family ATPase [Mycobacterium sp. 3519A]|uniref:AAA family ATPase n=1 Tax=Mycobacterium sp. 3519A TaxID=2057184 RepID=UPI000C7B94E4|nr:AAA family ATPase [Mycobacterium sp. 3519A]
MAVTDESLSTGADSTETSVHDVILEMLENDAGLNAEVKEAVLEALAEVVGETQDDTGAQTASTFLTKISVVGFRGIGPQAELDLYPAPGLMVISGRNGSGKSSFAEALELALTGTSYRWHEKKSTLWTESWRNLHHTNPCAIRVGFTAEGLGSFTVGVNWADEAELTHRTTWTQTGTDKHVDGTGHLGWSRPLELWRPVLSYDELGRLFDGGPSALYDALAKLLGLDSLAEAEKGLATQLKSTKLAREKADDERKRLLDVLSDSADERAQQAIVLLRKRGGASMDDLLALATGSDETGLRVTATLRALTQLETPTIGAIEAAASRLRTAIQTVVERGGELVDGSRQRVDLLQAALRFHEHAGDRDCPVCGQGSLDDDWAARTRDAVAASEESLMEFRTATGELDQARSAAVALIAALKTADCISEVELSGLAGYNDAVATARQTPEDDTALAAHVESTLVAAAVSADTLRAQAAEALTSRESAWAPLAAQLGGWVPMEEEARVLDATVKTMTAAKKWMSDHAGQFRNLRLEPIAVQAREIWSQLRQESNVDLGEITLEGTATRRRATLGGSVDGQPTKALSVMSQGEKHALALALFLPRATAPASPFRFVVLDDPIQAMDPAKIDGFVQVLSGIARTHQVIVFSHDDRLASVIRETGTDARLIEVVRESGSKVTIRDNVNPALRAVNDIFALIKDDRLPDDIRARVLPGLCRVAVESAAKQAFYTKQSIAGRPRADSENAWMSAKKTLSRLALAVHGDPSADLKGWLDGRPERRPTLRLCNAVHDEARGVSMREARELERTVQAVLALR